MHTRPLRIQPYGAAPAMPEEFVLLGAIVLMAVRDMAPRRRETEKSRLLREEAQSFLDEFFDGLRPDLLTAYQSGQVGNPAMLHFFYRQAGDD